MSDHSARMPRLHLPIRLGTNQRRWAYGSFALLWLSGVLWLVFHYFLQVESDFGPRPHVLEMWWLRLHGLAMMVVLISLGTLVLHHLHRAWQINKNRVLGGVLTLIFGWLGITGYALFYFSSDANQDWLPVAHWLPGLLLPLLIVLHVYAGRLLNRKPTSIIKRHRHWDEHPGNKTGTED